MVKVLWFGLAKWNYHYCFAYRVSCCLEQCLGPRVSITSYLQVSSGSWSRAITFLTAVGCRDTSVVCYPCNFLTVNVMTPSFKLCFRKLLLLKILYNSWTSQCTFISVLKHKNMPLLPETNYVKGPCLIVIQKDTNLYFIIISPLSSLR